MSRYGAPALLSNNSIISVPLNWSKSKCDWILIMISCVVQYVRPSVCTHCGQSRLPQFLHKWSNLIIFIADFRRLWAKTEYNWIWIKDIKHEPEKLWRSCEFEKIKNATKILAYLRYLRSICNFEWVFAWNLSNRTFITRLKWFIWISMKSFPRKSILYCYCPKISIETSKYFAFRSHFNCRDDFHKNKRLCSQLDVKLSNAETLVHQNHEHVLEHPQFKLNVYSIFCRRRRRRRKNVRCGKCEERRIAEKKKYIIWTVDMWITRRAHKLT